MHASSRASVSIVIPSYNRARFLPAAFASIQAQSFRDWEIIVVDDGSTDDTGEVVERLAAQLPGRVAYHYQTNSGPAAARNQGARLARGGYIAFFDSDDLWLPHHLSDCVAALERHADVDWVYAACRVVDLETDAEIQASSFYPRGERHPFLGLAADVRGRLHVLTDPAAAECMITHGLMCGLQCSVMRREVLERTPIPAQRSGEDQTFIVYVLKAGRRLAYFDNVHVMYRVHDECVSARERNGNVEKAVRYIRELAEAYEEVPQHVPFTARERRALRERLAHDYFWTIGYGLYWQHGRRSEALNMYKRGLRWQPWSARMWKTFGLAMARQVLSRGAVPA
jgi:glycosyltransferase involved in cell wall biosynthesis